MISAQESCGIAHTPQAVKNESDRDSRDVVRTLVRILEHLDCAVVEVEGCDETDIYSLQIICSAHRTATKLNKISCAAIP